MEEAISEIQREMDVRRRLFDRWVSEGRMSWVDAHDRLERHLTALKLLIQYSNEIDQASADDNNTALLPDPVASGNALDMHPEAQAA